MTVSYCSERCEYEADNGACLLIAAAAFEHAGGIIDEGA
jgi:hypothetical protein